MRATNQRIAGVAAEEPPGFEPEPKSPFEAALLHPARGAANSPGGKIERGANLDTDRDRQSLEVAGRSNAPPWVVRMQRTECRPGPPGCARQVPLLPRASARGMAGARCRRSEGRGIARKGVPPLPWRPRRHPQTGTDDIPASPRGRSTRKSGPNPRLVPAAAIAASVMPRPTAPISQDKVGPLVDRPDIGVLLSQHGVMNIGRDEETGLAFIDQFLDRCHRLGHRERCKRNTPNPDWLGNLRSRRMPIRRSFRFALISRAISVDSTRSSDTPSSPEATAKTLSPYPMIIRPVQATCIPILTNSRGLIPPNSMTCPRLPLTSTSTNHQGAADERRHYSAQR